MRLPSLPSLPSANVALPPSVAAACISVALTMAPLTALPGPACADQRVIGEVQGSGLVFKDTLKVEAFDDPKVSGVQVLPASRTRRLAPRRARTHPPPVPPADRTRRAPDPRAGRRSST